MKTDDTNEFEEAYLREWREATRHYLFADLESLRNDADATHSAPPSCAGGPHDQHDAPPPEGHAAPVDEAWSPPGADSHGGQTRFIARARGRLLRLARRAQQDNPLWELEHAFQLQISFIARHPDVPRRLLTWLSQDGDTRLRRRVQAVIDHYAARLARIISRAKHQGLVKAEIQPDSAAMLLIGMIQGFALGIHAGRREGWFMEAAKTFALYRASLVYPSTPSGEPQP